MIPLTVIILTYNEEENIRACIASARFGDRMLVFDSFSTDNTTSHAGFECVPVIQHPFRDYASQRNAALDAVDTEWVLFLDADERMTPELAEEIRTVIRDTDAVGFRIPRHNYIFGKLTCGAGWYPDYQTRLLKRGCARYDPAVEVHEVVLLDGPEGTLTHPLIHYNYRDLAQFVAKQQRYVQYDAQILHKRGIRPKPQNYVLQPLRHFWWRFVTLHGYRDGLHGLRLSGLMAWYELRKYVLLRGLWRGEVGAAG
ncbi:MAG: glycosyltransferase family 2 protein [Chloroflexi bacterium]|nr:glycosyltransferase family 2 protein [Chloroflexota bacterium]